MVSDYNNILEDYNDAYGVIKHYCIYNTEDKKHLFTTNLNGIDYNKDIYKNGMVDFPITCKLENYKK
jgi:hypothetical protein